MERELANMKQALYDQGYLDDHFTAFEKLQDGANPNFVEEVVTLYYRDSPRLIQTIDQALEENPLDFTKLDTYMVKFIGGTASIGAKQVRNESTKFREYCTAANADGCKRTFRQLKEEHATLKNKLEAYFQLSRQIDHVDKASPPK